MEKHLKVHKTDKYRVILKTGIFTITLYEKPKKEPRSKLHIQSGDQNKNLEFILECLSLFYREVCCMTEKVAAAVDYKEMQRSLCGKCGKLMSIKRDLNNIFKECMLKKQKRLQERWTEMQFL